MKNDTWLDSWFKVYRRIQYWEWFKNAKTLQVFLYLLANANVTDCAFEGITIKRGELATSYASIAKMTGQSIQSVRTAIKHLKSTGEITSRTFGKFSVISIEKYNPYQSKQQAKQQAPNKGSTSKQQQYKNNKNNKKERNKAACAKIEPRDWELRLNVPETMIGAFDTEQNYLNAMEDVL